MRTGEFEAMTDDELKRAIVSGSFGSVLTRSLQSALDRVRRMVRPLVSDNSTTLAPLQRLHRAAGAVAGTILGEHTASIAFATVSFGNSPKIFQ